MTSTSSLFSCAECATIPARLNENLRSALCQTCREEREHHAALADHPGVGQDWPIPDHKIIHGLNHRGESLCGEPHPRERGRKGGVSSARLGPLPQAGVT
jgi:hypothetical protein